MGAEWADRHPEGSVENRASKTGLPRRRRRLREESFDCLSFLTLQGSIQTLKGVDLSLVQHCFFAPQLFLATLVLWRKTVDRHQMGGQLHMDGHFGAHEFQRALVAAYPNLLRYAEALTNNRTEAWDLVHETMERSLRRQAGFKHGDCPNRWLATILRRIFIDHCRKGAVARRNARRWAREEAAEEADRASSPVSSPEVPKLEEEVRSSPPWEAFSVEDVRRAVMFLAPVFRAPYSMFAFDGLSYAEIGRDLSLTPGTVASRVFRARQRLRELLLSGAFRLQLVAAPSPGATVRSNPREAFAPGRDHRERLRTPPGLLSHSAVASG